MSIDKAIFCKRIVTFLLLDFIVNSCTNQPCKNGGTCTVTGEGTYSCKCAEGYYGDSCEKGNYVVA